VRRSNSGWGWPFFSLPLLPARFRLRSGVNGLPPGRCVARTRAESSRFPDRSLRSVAAQSKVLFQTGSPRTVPLSYYPGCRQPLLVNTRFQSRPGLLNGHCSPTNAHLAVCGPSGSGERSTQRRLWGVIAISVSNIQVVHSRWSGFLRSKEDWYVRSGGRRYLLSTIRSR
jgi:hypothetical protein